MQDLVYVTSQFNREILTVFMWSLTIGLHTIMHWQRRYKGDLQPWGCLLNRRHCNPVTHQLPDSVNINMRQRQSTTISHHAPALQSPYDYSEVWNCTKEKGWKEKCRWVQIYGDLQQEKAEAHVQSSTDKRVQGEQLHLHWVENPENKRGTS